MAQRPHRGPEGKAVGAPKDDSSAQRIKDAALRLFSSRGTDAVTVREIVAAAGARNNASLHYYFGSKDALIRELIMDCANYSDTARIARLNALEAADGPYRIEDIVRLVIEVETVPRDPDGDSVSANSSGHMRFVMGLQINHRRLFMQALAGRRNSGYMRCLEHLYALMPQVPKATMNQRLIYMDLFIGAALAAREAAFEQSPSGGKLWGANDAVENLIASTCGLLMPEAR